MQMEWAERQLYVGADVAKGAGQATRWVAERGGRGGERSSAVDGSVAPNCAVACGTVGGPVRCNVDVWDFGEAELRGGWSEAKPRDGHRLLCAGPVAI